MVEGRVTANRAGFGFVRVEGMTESVFLPPREMSQLMHGDRVRISAEQGADQRWSGKVDKVLERGIEAFLATVEIQGRFASVRSADRRLALQCDVAPADLNGAKQGSWVIARITRYPEDGRNGAARIEQQLDPEKPVSMATETAIARFNLPREFSSAALREAQAFGANVDPAESANRVDLRGLPLVTIDGADARDFDDALYAQRNAQGFRLIVAIADVSHYVREGSALDDGARERGTSVYFPTRVLPMLPTALSNHLCSLEPNVDRLCMVADMQVSKQGALIEARFYTAVMRSHARLTYTQAFAALFEGRPEAREPLAGLIDSLLPLVEVFRALHGARVKRGALDFDAPEASFAIDSGEHITGVNLYARNDAHRLVEECMVLANVATARELGRRSQPTLYRVHAEPDEKKIATLIKTLATIGIHAEIPGDIKTRDLQGIAPRVKDPAARPFVESLVVRSLMQAMYQPENLGHFGLALEQYAHFTSPIRRYPDLVVHRTLKALAAQADAAAVAYSTEKLLVMGEDLSRLEKRADEGARYVSAFLKCVYLRDRIGQSFEGLITAVMEFGLFVQILDAAADGLLHTTALRDDEYEMEDSQQAWVGKRTRRRLALGTHVRVVLTAVNPVEGLIDLELADTGVHTPSGTAPQSGRRSKRP
ncbi:MAG: ribonuclease R [Steroidobacteraceae bacterium]